MLKYREAFFDGTYLVEFPEHRPFVAQFSEVLAQQMTILRQGMNVFKARCPPTLQLLYEHLDDFLTKMQVEVTSMLP